VLERRHVSSGLYGARRNQPISAEGTRKRRLKIVREQINLLSIRFIIYNFEIEGELGTSEAERLRPYQIEQ